MASHRPMTRSKKRKRPNGDAIVDTPTKGLSKITVEGGQTNGADEEVLPVQSDVICPSPTTERARESPLCEVCRTVLDKYDLAEDLRTILSTSEDLESRAKEGCHLCALFLSLFTDDEKKNLATRTETHELEYIKSRELQAEDLSPRRLILSSGDLADPESISKDVLLVPVEGKFKPDGKGHASLAQADEISAVDDQSRLSQLDGSTASEQSIEVARKWLKECSTQHTCRKRADNFVPTRLIDVGVSSIPEPRLCLGADLPPDQRYLTLSHCWGHVVPTRLLKDNFDSMVEAIDYDQLPKTFQEAVSMTHRLGERYIWIDSLCIVQNDDEDWQNESAVMSSVYSYSWCNLSATFAKDGSQGLFVERNPELVRQIRVEVGKKPRNSVPSYAVDPDFWRKELIDAPLSQRAWVCQERLLSPCNLHFCSNQLVWECRCAVACETFPDGLPKVLPEGSSSVHHPLIKLEAGEVIGSSKDKNSDGESSAKVYDLWKAVVNLYTTASLSHETDKLIAIGGLASSLETASDDRYLAGLWANDLPNQLMWTRVVVNGRHLSPDYIAPTWSWASVKSSITFTHPYSDRLATTPLVTILSTPITPITSRNPYGQISSASLTLKGNLAKAHVVFDGHNPGVNLVIQESPPIPNPSSMTESQAVFATTSRAIANVAWDALTEDELLELDDEEFILLPVQWLGGNQHEAGSQQEEDVIVGLVLRASRDVPGKFRREGWFSYGMGVVEGGGESPRVMDGCRFFDTLAEGSGLVFEKEGEGCFLYTITII